MILQAGIGIGHTKKNASPPGPPDDAFGLYAQELLAPLMPLFKGSLLDLSIGILLAPELSGFWDGWVVNWPF